ncbi:MAG: YbdK family carboxylate-amine ligase [Actinobacteria bacterium]|nr:YbdK family carboxylate-amine ligase [Actinomycetota bacterium]
MQCAEGYGRHLTLGVEEELMLLDAETLALAPGVERLLGPPGLKTELFSCLIETNTPVCETAAEVLAELERLRAEVREAASREGIVTAATGAHPFSQPEEQEIIQERRYLAMLAERPSARRQLVCGLHVHVGMETFERCLATLEAILPWLPAVLALSVNSPYLEPVEPGVLSARAGRLLELPRAGAPPPLPDRISWERVASAVADYTKIWWDVRPHPRLGTLEIRIADQQTSVHRSGAFAALLQALCVSAEPAARPLDRDDYLHERVRATRGDTHTNELLALVEQPSRELGTWELVELLREPPEAHRQLEVGQRSGREAVAADVVARS